MRKHAFFMLINKLKSYFKLIKPKRYWNRQRVIGVNKIENVKTDDRY